MLEHVGEIVGGEQRVDRDRDDPRQHGAQESHRPVGAVVHEDQRALLAPDAALLEGRGELSDAMIELAVSHGAHVVDERLLVGAPRIDLKQVRREVERLGRRFHGAHIHRRLPGPGRKLMGRRPSQLGGLRS